MKIKNDENIFFSINITNLKMVLLIKINLISLDFLKI